MYSDVGKKIMGLAKVCGWICLIAGVIAWLILITNGYDSYYSGYHYYIEEDDIFGWLSLIVGVLGYISSWITYGFGQVVDDVHAMRNRTVEPIVAVEDDELPEL